MKTSGWRIVRFPEAATLHQLIFAPCQDNAAPRPLCPPTNPPSPQRLPRRNGYGKTARQVQRALCFLLFFCRYFLKSKRISVIIIPFYEFAASHIAWKTGR
jgi:hypothetical protein